MGTGGKYPLEFSGVELYRKLIQIANSLDRVLSCRCSPLLTRLRQRLSTLPNYQASFALLSQALKWIRQIAHLLEAEGSVANALPKLLNDLTQLKQHTSDGDVVAQWPLVTS